MTRSDEWEAEAEAEAEEREHQALRDAWNSERKAMAIEGTTEKRTSGS